MGLMLILYTGAQLAYQACKWRLVNLAVVLFDLKGRGRITELQ